MISLFSNGRHYQYFYHKETSTYLFIIKKDKKCEKGTCGIGAFCGYRKNDWSDFEEYWDSPQELLDFVEEHMKK